MGGIIPLSTLLLVLGESFLFLPWVEGKWLMFTLPNRALTGVPIAGEILHRCGGEYWGLIVFAGCAYAAGLGCFGFVMLLLKRRGGK